MRASTAAASLSLLLVWVPKATLPDEVSTGHAAQRGERLFDYRRGGRTGPEHWGELAENWRLCQTGQRQSPIDIDRRKVVEAGSGSRAKSENIHRQGQQGVEEVISPAALEGAPELDFSSHRARFTVSQSHGSTTLECPANTSCGTLNGVYRLQQLHFHSPSENALDGSHFPLELHILYAGAHGQAVVAVLFSALESNAEEDQRLNGIFNATAMSLAAGEEVRIGIHALSGLLSASNATVAGGGDGGGDGTSLEQHSAFFHWDGSLTTPPCREGVPWWMSTRVVGISTRQLATLTRHLHRTHPSGNARPVQPLNGRMVTLVGSSSPTSTYVGRSNRSNHSGAGRLKSTQQDNQGLFTIPVVEWATGVALVLGLLTLVALVGLLARSARQKCPLRALVSGKSKRCSVRASS